MPHMIIQHKVKDYNTWKPMFDEHATARKSAGCKGGKLFRMPEDPNHVVLIFEWDSHENAMKFTQSEDLRNTMKRAGVVDAPTIHFVDLVEEFEK